MKKYLLALERLIKQHSKAQVAVWLGVENTSTIDAWLKRETIPSKYLDEIERRNNK
jgi:hypothetical protein